MKIRPLQDRVIVKRIQEETRRLRERLEKLETAIEDYEQQSPQEEIKDV